MENKSESAAITSTAQPVSPDAQQAKPKKKLKKRPNRYTKRGLAYYMDEGLALFELIMMALASIPVMLVLLAIALFGLFDIYLSGKDLLLTVWHILTQK